MKHTTILAAGLLLITTGPRLVQGKDFKVCTILGAVATDIAKIRDSGHSRQQTKEIGESHFDPSAVQPWINITDFVYDHPKIDPETLGLTVTESCKEQAR